MPSVYNYTAGYQIKIKYICRLAKARDQEFIILLYQTVNWHISSVFK